MKLFLRPPLQGSDLQYNRRVNGGSPGLIIAVDAMIDQMIDSVLKCFWTLNVPAQENVERQLIVPDGCIEMAFILGDDIMRYTSGHDFILQPREMILGQITRQFYIKPTGAVDSFAVRFYPYGFASFARVDIGTLSNTETPLAVLFGEEASRLLAERVIKAENTEARIDIVERFLLDRLCENETVDAIVHGAIHAILEAKGNGAVKDIVKDDVSKRRH